MIHAERLPISSYRPPLMCSRTTAALLIFCAWAIGFFTGALLFGILLIRTGP